MALPTEGCNENITDGFPLGNSLLTMLGESLTAFDGALLTATLGALLPTTLGNTVGTNVNVGHVDGRYCGVGCTVVEGASVGDAEEGMEVGAAEGMEVGDDDGAVEGRMDGGEEGCVNWWLVG